MKTLRAIIVDDESNNRENLNLALKTHCPEVEIVGEADGIIPALTLIQNVSPDLVFLDIEMPNGSGFDLLESLSDIPFSIIFVTAYDQYAIRAIKFAAVDYLLKPIEVLELKKAVLKVARQQQNDNIAVLRSNLNDENPRIALPQTDGVDFIRVQDIIRCQSERNYTHFYLTDGRKLLVSKNLGEFAKLLEENRFYRVHQSHLVNLSKITRYVRRDGGYLITSDKAQIPIARNRKEGLLERLM